VASDYDLRLAKLDFDDYPGFKALEYSIVDFTDVTKLDLSSHTVRLVAATDAKESKRNPSLRVAIVGEDQLLLGLANMYRIEFDVKGGPWEQGQFATVDEARAWLAGEDQRREES